MRLLIVPMFAMATSSGPYTRSLSLARTAMKKGWETTLCVPSGSLFDRPDGLHGFEFPVPSPLGMPARLGTHLFPLAQRLGLNRLATMRSFDDVLKLTGNTDEDYLKAAVKRMQNLLQDEHFDAVYSEFSLPAIIAATVENVPLFGTSSFPTQPCFACNPHTVSGVNRVLRSFALEPVRSPEELLLWPKIQFIPSCPTLEPFPDCDSIKFTGFFKGMPNAPASSLIQEKNALVAYMGNGSIVPRRAVKVLVDALQGTRFTAYVAGLPEGVYGNVITAPSFDFSKLLPHAFAFLNHGGQNSVMDGIAYGVPQIICPGKVFERRFNAQSAQRLGVGIVLDHKLFDAEHLGAILDTIIENGEFMRKSAKSLCSELKSLGGANCVLDTIERSLLPTKIMPFDSNSI